MDDRPDRLRVYLSHALGAQSWNIPSVADLALDVADVCRVQGDRATAGQAAQLALRLGADELALDLVGYEHFALGPLQPGTQDEAIVRAMAAYYGTHGLIYIPQRGEGFTLFSQPYLFESPQSAVSVGVTRMPVSHPLELQVTCQPVLVSSAE